jgi:hypothetical protein
LKGVRLGALEGCVARVAAGLEAVRPMVLEPDEREGRRLAGGMARVTQAALLCEAAEWRAARKGDGSAVVAAEMFTREALVAPASADLELDALAYGFAA